MLSRLQQKIQRLRNSNDRLRKGRFSRRPSLKVDLVLASPHNLSTRPCHIKPKERSAFTCPLCDDNIHIRVTLKTTYLKTNLITEMFMVVCQIIPIESFETQSADGRYVPIIPNGHNVRLTFDNRAEYVDRALQYRLHEAERQVAAVREGMGWIIPVPLLSLLTPQKLEQMVCGSEEVNIDVLKKVARCVLAVVELFPPLNRWPLNPRLVAL